MFQGLVRERSFVCATYLYMLSHTLSFSLNLSFFSCMCCVQAGECLDEDDFQQITWYLFCFVVGGIGLFFFFFSFFTDVRWLISCASTNTIFFLGVFTLQMQWSRELHFVCVLVLQLAVS